MTCTKGIARVYDHVTAGMRRHILDALEARWLGSLAAPEQAQLFARDSQFVCAVEPIRTDADSDQTNDEQAPT